MVTFTDKARGGSVVQSRHVLLADHSSVLVEIAVSTPAGESYAPLCTTCVGFAAIDHAVSGEIVEGPSLSSTELLDLEWTHTNLLPPWWKEFFKI